MFKEIFAAAAVITIFTWVSPFETGKEKVPYESNLLPEPKITGGHDAPIFIPGIPTGNCLEPSFGESILHTIAQENVYRKEYKDFY